MQERIGVAEDGADEAPSSPHYDLPVEFFGLWLDPELNYSCARWDSTGDASLAQKNKLAWYGARLALGPGQKVIDVGCGWGGALVGLVRDWKVLGLGLTKSTSQAIYVNETVAKAGVSARLTDWNVYDPVEPVDAVINLEALEHFAPAGASLHQRREVYSLYFETVRHWLVPGGKSALQVICAGDGVHPELGRKPVTDFIYQQVFPASSLPTLTDIAVSAEPYFRIQVAENGTDDYVRTLTTWYSALRNSLPAASCAVGGRKARDFLRYLSSCALVFRRRDCELYRVIMERRPEVLKIDEKAPAAGTMDEEWRSGREG